MLFVSAIEPINHHTKRVVIADTESEYVGEIIYGDSVTDDVIRQRAPSVIEMTDAYRKIKRKKGTK